LVGEKRSASRSDSMRASNHVSKHYLEDRGSDSTVRAAHSNISRAPDAPISSLNNNRTSERHPNDKISSYKSTPKGLSSVASERTKQQSCDFPSFQPLPDRKHDVQLFRGSPLRSLPCGHSEAIPRHSVHAGNHRCVVHHADWSVCEPSASSPNTSKCT
jgi:hypothetical protein